MPSLQETLDEFHWPGLGNLLSDVKKGVDEYVPNPMRSLENAYNPVEHIGRALEIAGTPLNALAGAGAGALESFTSPASRKEMEKSIIAAMPAMAGAAGGRVPSFREGKAGMKLAAEGNPAGWVRTAPELAEYANKALGGMHPKVRDKILRSSKEYRLQPVTREAIERLWGPRAKDVGGWNQYIDYHGNPGRGNISYLDVNEKPDWLPGGVAHEFEHGLGKELGHSAQAAAVAGNEYTPQYRQYLLSRGYSEPDLVHELFADLNAGSTRRPYFTMDVKDPSVHAKFLDSLVSEKNDPTFVVDNALTSQPEKYRPNKGQVFFDEFQKDEAKKAFWEKKTKEKEQKQQMDFWKTEGAKPRPVGPAPEGELAELLGQLGSSPKVEMDLSKGGTLGEGDRPWNLPEARQSGIYDAMNPGKKKYGGSYTPGKATTFEMEGSNLRAQPIASSDMPSEVFDYMMQKNTPMHEDIPTVKESKRKALNNFTEWWQSASDDDRRMYTKMIQKTAEKPAAPQPKSAPRYQTMMPQGVDKKKARNEMLRLQNIAGLRKK